MKTRRTISSGKPKRSGAGFQPAAGASSPRSDHGQDARPGRLEACPTSGFTLVEIAIALGVIGFALVAIIGILPVGLQIQRDNRAETIINQDGTFWLEAIRNGRRRCRPR